MCMSRWFHFQDPMFAKQCIVRAHHSQSHSAAASYSYQARASTSSNSDVDVDGDGRMFPIASLVLQAGERSSDPGPGSCWNLWPCSVWPRKEQCRMWNGRRKIPIPRTFHLCETKAQCPITCWVRAPTRHLCVHGLNTGFTPNLVKLLV